jgi:hypothetical protein
MIWQSVNDRLEAEAPSLSQVYLEPISRGLNRFWREHQDDMAFRKAVVDRLAQVMPREYVSAEPHTLVECSTDATDLRMELPLLVLFPETTEQIRQIVLLANEMEFAIVPRGGGSGLTGGAVPGRRRSVVLSLSKLKHRAHRSREQDPVRPERRDHPDRHPGRRQGGPPAHGGPGVQGSLLAGRQHLGECRRPLRLRVRDNAGQSPQLHHGPAHREIIEVRRKDHPRHKILPDETVVFEILDEDRQVTQTLTMQWGRLPLPRAWQGRDEQIPGGPARGAEGGAGRDHHRGVLHPPPKAQAIRASCAWSSSAAPCTTPCW